MDIAIHAADLDHARIDGTRVYILNMLKNFGELNKIDSFRIYHQNEFNLSLTPPTFENYIVKKIPCPALWTQLRFAWQLFVDKPDVLWMPVHNVPIIRRKNLKVVVTIHDLAFKIFPAYFTKKDLIKLNVLSDFSIKNADRLIAVSEATKKDILKFYPKIDPAKITVIHHGFDMLLYKKNIKQELSDAILKGYGIHNMCYILHVGAIQPRKNLSVLIRAFEKIKLTRSNLKLVLAGAPAWQAKATLDMITASPFSADIIVTGTLAFAELPTLYRNAGALVFPSLYEGFGIPALEAMASGCPTILANNSSLVEAGGDAALYFETENFMDLSEKIENVFSNEFLREKLIKKGLAHSANFSWEKCATQTLDILTKW